MFAGRLFTLLLISFLQVYTLVNIIFFHECDHSKQHRRKVLVSFSEYAERYMLSILIGILLKDVVLLSSKRFMITNTFSSLRIHSRLSTILKQAKKVYEVMFFDM